MVKCESKRFKRIVSFVGFQLTLPYNDYMPSHLCQLPLLFLVTLFVTHDFLLPKVGIRLRKSEVLTAIMSVPEAAVDKHTRAVLAQHDIGMTGQTRIVQSVSESLSPQIFAHKYLRLGIRRANRSHIFVSLLRRKNIHAANIGKFEQNKQLY